MRRRWTFLARMARGFSDLYFLVVGGELTPQSGTVPLLSQPLLRHNKPLSE